MALLDGDIGEILSCDRCGIIYKYDEESSSIKDDWLYRIFANRQKPKEIHKDFCPKCTIYVIPYVHVLLEISHLNTSINKLEKEIKNVKRNENNRPFKNSSGKLCTCSISGGDGHIESRSIAQAGEEHY